MLMWALGAIGEVALWVPVEGVQPVGQQLLQLPHLPQKQATHRRLFSAGRADALCGQVPHVDFVLQLCRTRMSADTHDPTAFQGPEAQLRIRR